MVKPDWGLIFTVGVSILSGVASAATVLTATRFQISANAAAIERVESKAKEDVSRLERVLLIHETDQKDFQTKALNSLGNLQVDVAVIKSRLK